MQVGKLMRLTLSLGAALLLVWFIKTDTGPYGAVVSWLWATVAVWRLQYLAGWQADGTVRS